jgi:hypothetical protein
MPAAPKDQEWTARQLLAAGFLLFLIIVGTIFAAPKINAMLTSWSQMDTETSRCEVDSEKENALAILCEEANDKAAVRSNGGAIARPSSGPAQPSTPKTQLQP